mmetsp:Transcript_20961/g.57284  ORF Transcript_20961/g.57284 Transcript_20961/m.57284 type:complete len:369 (+) Transcript_20961:187-1293(+)
MQSKTRPTMHPASQRDQNAGTGGRRSAHHGDRHRQKETARHLPLAARSASACGSTPGAFTCTDRMPSPPNRQSHWLLGNRHPAERHHPAPARLDHGLRAIVHAIEHELGRGGHHAPGREVVDHAVQGHEELDRLLQQLPALALEVLALRGQDAEADLLYGRRQDDGLDLDHSSQDRLGEPQQPPLLRIGAVVGGALHVVLEGHKAARLHDAEALRKEPLEVGGVAEDLHIVQAIKVRVWERQPLVVVMLHKLELLVHASLLCVLVCKSQLHGVNVDAGDIRTCVRGDMVSNAAPATADVQDLGPGADVQGVCHAPLIDDLVLVHPNVGINPGRGVHLLVVPNGAQVVEDPIVVKQVLELIWRAIEGVL